MRRKSGNALHSLGVPLTLELQIVNGDNGLHVAEELSVMETLLHVYGNQTCLPVVAVYHIRLKTDHGQGGKYCLGEISVSFDLPSGIVAVYLRTAEIELIINKIIVNAVNLGLQDSDINALPVEVQIEMADIFHLVLPLLLHTGIFGKNHSDIEVLLIYTFRQGAHYIGKTSCLDKRNTFRSRKQYFFHCHTSMDYLLCYKILYTKKCGVESVSFREK